MSRRKALSEVMVEFRSVHGERYDYSNFHYVSNRTLGTVSCKVHGPFQVTPINHLRGSKCPSCCESFKAKCERLSVDYYRALKRRQARLADEAIFDPSYIRSERSVGRISVFGKTYQNLKAAVRAIQPPAPRETIGRWLRSGMSPEEAFTRIPNPGVASGFIYLVTNIHTQKRYVGLTVQSIERRWTYHIEQATAGSIRSDVSLHAAIRAFGVDAFVVKELDTGTSKRDLEHKERLWIKQLGTAVPGGYNLTPGGESGGSNKRPRTVDGILFPGTREAALYIAETRSISYQAAKGRLRKSRLDVRAPSPPGKAVTKTAAYRAWSNIIHGAINPKSQDYIGRIDIQETWRSFDAFLVDVGQPPSVGMCFTRLDKDRGYVQSNCRWLPKSEASRINAAHMKQNGRLVGSHGRRQLRDAQPGAQADEPASGGSAT
jgi:hypothetical protein